MLERERPILDEVIRNLPDLHQMQDSTQDQMRDLWRVATKIGFYDAADLIKPNTGLGRLSNPGSGTITVRETPLLDEVIRNFPELPQRQDSTQDQMSDLWEIANKLGFNKAADVIKPSTRLVQ